MDDKFRNYEICSAIREKAEQIFEELDVPDGTYTASDILKQEKQGLIFVKGSEPDALVDVQIDKFKCSFPKKLVFYFLNKFEKLASVKKKAMFTKLKQEVLPDVSFDIDVSDNVEHNNFLEKDNENECFRHVFVDVERKLLVSTNGHELLVKSVQISNLKRNGEKEIDVIFLTPEMIKTRKIAHVSVFVETTKKKVHFTTIDGKYISSEYSSLRYLGWERVIPNINPQGYFKLTNQSLQQFLQWLSMCCNVKRSTPKKPLVTLSKSYYAEKFRITFKLLKGSSKVDVTLESKSSCTQTTSIELERPSGDTFEIKFFPKPFLCMPNWNGAMWIKGNSYAVIFDSLESEDTFLSMPLAGPETYNIDSKSSHSYSERHTILKNLQSDSSQKQIIKQETITEPEQERDTLLIMSNSKKTDKRYRLEDLESGKYIIRDKSHDPELQLLIQSMAHYLIGRTEMQLKVIDNFKKRYGTPKNNPDFFLHYPLSEMELAETIGEVFAAEGIDDIPDWYGEEKAVEEKPVMMKIESKQEPVSEPDEADEEVEEIEEVEEVEEESSTVPESFRSGLKGGTCIVPIMELETNQGTLVISTYDSFAKLNESSHPKDIALIDRIDAFIDDDVFNTDPIDLESIAAEVESFLALVEEESNAL